jgi:hypothetical protein
MSIKTDCKHFGGYEQNQKDLPFCLFDTQPGFDCSIILTCNGCSHYKKTESRKTLDKRKYNLLFAHNNTDITKIELPTPFNEKIAWIVLDDGKSKRLFFEKENP